MAISICVAGASYAARPAYASASGAGSALRSSLPFAVSGHWAISTYALGTMYSGSPACSAARRVSAVTSPVCAQR